MELITINQNEAGEPVVAATDLYAFLAPRSQFSKWIDRFLGYGFIKDQDYEVLVKKDYNLNGGRPTTDYILTLDTAKHIAMMNRTEKGMRIRQYFIECEKKLRELAQHSLPEPAKPTSLFYDKGFNIIMNRILDQDRKISKQNDKIEKLESQVKQLKAQPEVDEYMTVSEFISVRGISFNSVNVHTFGSLASRVCKGKGFPIQSIPDGRYGSVNKYPEAVLAEIYRSKLV